MGKYKTQVKLKGNTKTSSKGKDQLPVLMTARPADTCPSCIFNGLGGDHKPSEGGTSCYAANKPGGGSNLFQNAEEKGTTDTASAFKTLAKNAPPGATIRHLESGDIQSPEKGDDYIAEANKFAAARPDLKHIAYTHNDDELDPNSMVGWKARASKETRSQVADAIDRGWTTVIESPSDDLLSARGERIAGKPVRQCPAQTHPESVGCANCNMCRKENVVVEFALHGNNLRINEGRIRAVRHAEQGQPVNMGTKIPIGPPQHDDWATGQNRITNSSTPDGDSIDTDKPSRNSGFITGFSERNV